MRHLFLSTVAGVAALSAGQVNLNQPVSRRASYAVLARHTAAMAKVLPAIVPTKPTGGSEPLTREELILEMGRLFDQAKPSFKWTPTHPRISVDQITKNNSKPEVQAVLKKLVRYGCVGPVGPLVVGPGPGLTINQFGAAVGIFEIRIAHLCHMPDPKFSPDLRTGKEGTTGG